MAARDGRRGWVAAGRLALWDPPVSREPHIRNVQPDELEEVWRVHVASSSDLAVRRGRPARPADEPVSGDARAGLVSDPEGYFCAVAEGRICGMVSALGARVERGPDAAYLRPAPRRKPALARAAPVRGLGPGRRGARRASTGTTPGRGPGSLLDGRDGAAMADLVLAKEVVRAGKAFVSAPRTSTPQPTRTPTPAAAPDDGIDA